MRFIKIHLLGQRFRSLELAVGLGPLDVERSLIAHQLFIEGLDALLDLCADMDLRVSCVRTQQLRDAQATAGSLAADPQKLGAYWRNLDGVVAYLRGDYEAELSLRRVLMLDDDDAALYENANPFGEEVAAAFPSAVLDIEEAGKCLALHRNTACVFHLMRVMEVGLRVLAGTLNDRRLDPKRNPSWDAILRKCDDELQRPLAQRAPEWVTDDAFFSGAAARLRAVKDAWRNPTMHVELTYDEERAQEVWNHVGSFMRHIGTKLRES